MTNKKLNKLFLLIIAGVWFTNGLFFKVFNLIPRHRQIVSRILGAEFSSLFTFLIGVSEVIMAIWIISGIKPRLNAFAQICIIATMNILEFILVPELLLWGRLNALFAFLFICFIYYNEFILGKSIK